MPDVDITIGGRTFQVSCQEGEEHFLRGAAQMLDAEAQMALLQSADRYAANARRFAAGLTVM